MRGRPRSLRCPRARPHCSGSWCRAQPSAGASLSKKRKKPSADAYGKSDKELHEDLRAERTRVGRIRRTPVFLSYNHKEPNSAAIMLTLYQ